MDLTFQPRREMTGRLASAVFGETLWRHLCLSHCVNRTALEVFRKSVSPVTYSSGDPPFRGSEKTALVGSPPVTKGLRMDF